MLPRSDNNYVVFSVLSHTVVYKVDGNGKVLALSSLGAFVPLTPFVRDVFCCACCIAMRLAVRLCCIFFGGSCTCLHEVGWVGVCQFFCQCCLCLSSSPFSFLSFSSICFFFFFSLSLAALPSL